MKLPYIPVAHPEQRMDAAFHFCSEWAESIITDCEDYKMVMMPYDYYKEKLCTSEEAARIDRELREHCDTAALKEN